MLVFKTWYFGDKIYENVLSIKANPKKKKENILIVKNNCLLTEVGNTVYYLKESFLCYNTVTAFSCQVK